MSIILKAAESGLEYIIRTNIHMADMKNESGLMNEAYAKVGRFEAGKMPSKILIGVAYFPFGAAVKIECIAEVVER
jgi:2-iminobutanoate/2-iminopropanoate deaminase